MSIFLGSQLSDVFDQIQAGGAKTSRGKTLMEVGVDTLPHLSKDPGDRNRTSPFAFTGNRFEFRAVGSGQSVAGPLMAVNTALAESLDFCASKLEAAVAAKQPLNAAIQELIAGIMKEHGAVVFNGDGYSKEWHDEAAKRGLPNNKTTPEALPALQAPAVVAMFDKYKVLSPRELSSRYEICLEQYIKAVNVEANLAIKIAKTVVLPAALRYQTELASNAAALKAAGVSGDTTLLTTVTKLIGEILAGLGSVEAVHGKHVEGGLLEESKHYCDTLLPAMLKLRESVDALEGVMDDSAWPLPTYQEMLFIK
jgi:glutamine synthetase